MAPEIIIVFVTIFVTILIYLKRKHSYWENRKVPTIPGHFPFGNIKTSLFSHQPGLGVQLADLYKRLKENGVNNYAGVYILSTPLFLPMNPDIIKSIIAVDYQHFNTRGIYSTKHQPVTQQVFSATGERWRSLRQKLTPTFTSGKMKMMFETLRSTAYPMVDTVNELTDKNEPIDIKHLVGSFTIDVIGSCAFGIECNSFENKDSDFLKQGYRIFNFTLWESIKFLFLISLPKLSSKLRLTQFADEPVQFFTKIVENIVAYREKNNVTRKDFMQLLLEIKMNSDNSATSSENDRFTLNDMTAHSFLFFLAGFETSSSAMTFALLELAQNSDIQDKTRDEVQKVLQKYNGEITYEAINEMTYLTQVIEETLRKYPVLPLIPRRCTKTYNLPGTDLVFNKNDLVIFSVLGIHMDPEYYPNPTKFDPDRFSEENKSNRNPYTYLPFGEGPRMCIGTRFAYMQTRVGLASLLNKFHFTLNNKTKMPLEYENTIPLVVVGKVWLNAKKIE